MRAALAFAVVLLLPAVPHVASACAVCMSGRDDETRLAFLLTTLFLSVLPVALVGGFAWWLVRRSRQLARQQTELSRSTSSP